jgi:predicted HTH transcriptional regulator
MYKIIELDIDSSLSADTGVFEVAWVESPAIEQEMMYFKEMNFFVAPEYVQRKACQAIKENEKRGNPAGTQVGKVRAQQLCNGENLSLETIKRDIYKMQKMNIIERKGSRKTGYWQIITNTE